MTRIPGMGVHEPLEHLFTRNRYLQLKGNVITNGRVHRINGFQTCGSERLVTIGAECGRGECRPMSDNLNVFPVEIFD